MPSDGDIRRPWTWGSGSVGEEAAMLSRNSSAVLAEVREGGGCAAWNWQKRGVGIHTLSFLDSLQTPKVGVAARCEFQQR